MLFRFLLAIFPTVTVLSSSRTVKISKQLQLAYFSFPLKLCPEKKLYFTDPLISGKLFFCMILSVSIFVKQFKMFSLLFFLQVRCMILINIQSLEMFPCVITEF